MLKIGDFSRLAQVSPKALRIYDERGLLRPAWIDRFTGYRYYAPQQLARLHRILALKDLGFSLDQIGELLEGDLEADDLGRLMRERQRELSRHIAAEQARLVRVEARLQQLDRAISMPNYDIVLKPVRPMTVAGLRSTLPHKSTLPDLLQTLRLEARRLGITADTAVPVLGIYYDQVYREHNLDVEVAVPLQCAVRQTGDMIVHDLPGVEQVASAVHRGPISQLPAAYEAVLTWLHSSGYQPAGPNRDLFLQPPDAGDGGETAVTEVQFPAREKPFLSPVAKPKDKQTMETKIETKPAFTAVGLPYFGKNENKKEIPELWDQFIPRGSEIKHVSGPAYGLCSAADPDGRFHYLAGFGVSEVEDVPEGMESWDVPEETYAVFTCELKTIGEAYKYAAETWQPQSDYVFKKGIDFELYTEEFNPDTGNETLYVYIPVKKKA